jgi:GNAT superfamily N-acetyltransferase
MTDIEILEPVTTAHFDAVRRLFREYIDFLYTLANMQVHIDMQKPDMELAELETGKYAPPEGAILLACRDNEYVGAVALRKFENEICEMKRLYVRPASRSSAVGRLLASHIIQKARAIGYTAMRLDTHPSMTKAHQLYYSLGFQDIPRYNENLVPGALFMELDLTR